MGIHAYTPWSPTYADSANMLEGYYQFRQCTKCPTRGMRWVKPKGLSKCQWANSKDSLGICGGFQVCDGCKDHISLRNKEVPTPDQTELEKHKKVIAELTRYFTSGNEIPVERAIIYKKDFDAIVSILKTGE